MGTMDSLLNELQRVLQCQICTDTMTAPFVLTCGHSFCYSCSYEWLQSHKSCPACRKKIRSKPVLVYTLKEISELMTKKLELRSKADTSTICSPHHFEKQQQYQHHARDPFPGLFREHDGNISGGRFADHEDNVTRCIRCHWEIEGIECSHCGLTFSEDEGMLDNVIDTVGYASDDNDSQDEFPNEYDLSDSFIASEDEASDSSPDDPGRRTERPHRSVIRSEHARIVISSDDDDSAGISGRSSDNRPRSRGYEHDMALDISSSDDGSRMSSNPGEGAFSRHIPAAALAFHSFTDEADEENEIGQHSLGVLRGRRIVVDDDSDG